MSDVVQAPEEGVLDEFAAEWFRANGALLDPPDEYTAEYLAAARSPTCPFPTRDVAKVTDDVVAGVPVRIYEHDTEPTGLVVYFHGGGFCTGSIGLMENIATELACASGAAVVSVEYRLAPEHPYPASLDDGDAVTRWVRAHAVEFGIPQTRVAVAGESAGGNLAAAVALRMRDDHEPGLAGQVLIYPALDGPSVPYASRTEFEHLGPKELDRVWAMLCGDGERVRELEHDPYLVPLQAESLAGLPPALVVLAGCDGLRDEGRLYARRLADAGVAAEEWCCPGQPHGFMNLGFPAAADAYARIGPWLRAVFAAADARSTPRRTQMSADDELEQLRRDVRYVKDRLDILDCVHNQSRGHDRHDVEIMTSVYHDDGVDEHGPAVNPGPAYGEWANGRHSAVFAEHLHNITTHTCEIDGDVAHCESYVIGSMVFRDGTSVSLMGGRYLDRLERRDGEWKIALRRCTIEWALQGDGSLLHSGAFGGFLKGTWDRNDLSYARPLQLDSEPAERW